MEKNVVELEVLTPVHIGSHEGELTSYDYTVLGDTLYVIHQGRLAEFLYHQGRIDEYVRALERKGRAFDIGEFLQLLRVGKDDLMRLSKYEVEAEPKIGMRELRPHIRDAQGRDYIPGSSIKGAMRTACAYIFLKRMKSNDPRRFEKVLDSVKNKLTGDVDRRDRRDRKSLFKKLEKDFFQGFDIRRFQNKEEKFKHGPYTDVLRCLKVTDAYPVRRRVAAINARVMDKGPDGRLQTESPLYIEAIVEGTYRFEVSWDEWLARKLLDENIKRVEASELVFPRGPREVFEACREFVEDQLNWEEGFFRGCLDGEGLRKSVVHLREKANFRLGWGSGLVGASISLLLPEELKRDIRKAFFNRYDKRVSDFPKSRRVVFRGNVPASLLGFCHLKVIATG